MKNLIFYFAIIVLSIVACQDNSDELVPSQDVVSIDMSDFYVYTDDNDYSSAKSATGSHKVKCYSMKLLNNHLKENPGLENRMYNIEKHSRTFIAAKKGGKGGGKGGNNTNISESPELINDGLGTITIPVYVYVIYNTSQQNISDAQINSQITVLNNDFNDSSYDNIPTEFEGSAANVNINFTLSNVERHESSTYSWGYNSDFKKSYPAVPGHLTIWVANLGSSLLGYATFPGGDSTIDGVVVSTQCFGTTGYLKSPNNKGRTATHEVGHWLNLRHIWGDGNCRQDDFVTDTPSSDGPNFGNPIYPTVNCKSNDMTMNYMDYTDDAYMNMFSLGQKNRMRSIFADGGPRASIR